MGRGRSGASRDDRSPAPGEPAIPDPSTPPPPTADVLDRATVEAVLAGDRDAFRRLVERESGSVVRVCQRILGDGAEAEDVAQEAFVIAYRSLATWRGDGPFGAWLARIAVRLAVRQAGKRGPVVWRDPGAAAEGDDRLGFEVARAADRAALAATERTDPARMAVRAERAGEVRAAVAALPEPYREVVALRFFADASLEEIARQTGRPLGTVKTHLHRGLARLRPAITSGDAR
jgi:RNA polymerase sigma-70 factor (ECF subfamily)